MSRTPRLVGGGADLPFQSFSELLISLWDLRAWLIAEWPVRFLTADNRGDDMNRLFLVDSFGLGHYSRVVGIVWSASDVVRAFWACSWMVFAFLAI